MKAKSIRNIIEQRNRIQGCLIVTDACKNHPDTYKMVAQICAKYITNIERYANKMLVTEGCHSAFAWTKFAKSVYAQK